MASTFRERQLPPAEVRRVLQRAAQLADADPDTAAVERPLTQDEIARRAAELGIPASAVQRAIAAPEAPEPAGDRPWLAPRTVVLEQEIPGELPSERHEEVVHAIRAAAGVDGRTEVLGKTLTWSVAPALKPLITIRSKDGRTHVRVEEPLNGALMLAAFSVTGLLASLMTGAAAMDLSRAAPVATVVGALTMVCALVASTFLVKRNVRRREAFLERMMERAALAVRSAVEPPPRAERARIAEGAGGEPTPVENAASVESGAEVEAAEAEAAGAGRAR